MVAQKGKDLLLKVEPTSGAGYSTVAGMRSRKISLNTDTVDITDFESAGRWRELLAGAGVQRASITGSGLFKDATSDEYIRGIFFQGSIVNWQIIVPNFGTLQGLFQVSSLEYSGEHNGEVNFEMSLESAGQLNFMAAA